MPLLQSCCSSALYYRLRTQALHICLLSALPLEGLAGKREDEFWTRLDSSKTSTQLNWGRFVSCAWLWRLTRFLHQPKQESSACSQAIAYVTLILGRNTKHELYHARGYICIGGLLSVLRTSVFHALRLGFAHIKDFVNAELACASLFCDINLASV